MYFDIIDIIAKILFRNILLFFEFLYNLLLILLLKDDNKHFIIFFFFFLFSYEISRFHTITSFYTLMLSHMIQVPIFYNIIFSWYFFSSSFLKGNNILAFVFVFRNLIKVQKMFRYLFKFLTKFFYYNN